MKLTSIFFAFLFVATTQAQESNTVKYFDSLWSPINKDSAFFNTVFIKQEDSFYNCYSYWGKSGLLNCKSTFKDTSFSYPIGRLVRFYQSGNVEDSIRFDENGQYKEVFHFYENGRLYGHVRYDNLTKKEYSEGYDEKGNLMKDFVFFKEAEFPGGIDAWKKYITKSLKRFNPSTQGAPRGTYKVTVRFLVDENGQADQISAETNFGYEMETQAVEIIRLAPKWIPAQRFGKFVKAFRRQPITFVVTKN